MTDPRTEDTAPIGILDSGMGGISVWARIVRQMPRESVIYWADSAHCPYGAKSRDEITARVETGVKALLQEGAKIIVIACNTATTAAIAYLRQQYPQTTFVGLEPAVKPAVERTRSGVVGVLATRYTVESEMFRRTRERFAAEKQVIATAGEGLVDLVENGRHRSPEAEQLLRTYIEPMLEAGADQLVLACTHYPLLMETIRRIAGERMEIIDPAPAIARHTFRLLQEQGRLRGKPQSGPGQYRFISTAGETAARKLKERAKEYTFTPITYHSSER